MHLFLKVCCLKLYTLASWQVTTLPESGLVVNLPNAYNTLAAILKACSIWHTSSFIQHFHANSIQSPAKTLLQSQVQFICVLMHGFLSYVLTVLYNAECS